jgi:hypothetical protein
VGLDSAPVGRCRLGRIILVDITTARDEASQSTFDFSARQEYAPAAGLAFQANVGAKPDHRPFEPTAGVWFFQPHDVADGERDQLGPHSGPPRLVT